MAYDCGGDVKEATGFLLHCVGCYDHATGLVSQPTVILDKVTRDAHDNPVISVDEEGYVWVFSTSHGTLRPSFIHRSCEPYSIERFERIDATRQEDGQAVPMDNFSYFQVRHVPGVGFLAGMTRYLTGWGCRAVGFIHSRDGVSWEPWVNIGRIDQGHYQVSEVCGERFGTAFNAHPAEGGLNYRTNLYYLQTPDLGKTWLTAAGQPVTVPVSEWDNPALVYDFRAEGRLVYVRDIAFDPAGRPIVLIITSKNFRPGPAGAPRFWQLACWTGSAWEIRTICPADCNYDMGSLYFEPDGTWKLIAPTEPGPQPGNPGGEIARWTSSDEGRSWQRESMLTSDSEYNHTFVRRPINAADGFYAFWADGHARQSSPSRLYFCDQAGAVYRLPAMGPGPAKPSVL